MQINILKLKISLSEVELLALWSTQWWAFILWQFYAHFATVFKVYQLFEYLHD